MALIEQLLFTVVSVIVQLPGRECCVCNIKLMIHTKVMPNIRLGMSLYCLTLGGFHLDSTVSCSVEREPNRFGR